MTQHGITDGIIQPTLTPATLPKVEIKKNIETTVTFTLSLEEATPAIISYLKRTYPEFRRKNLTIELDLNDTNIICHGYKLEK